MPSLSDLARQAGEFWKNPQDAYYARKELSELGREQKAAQVMQGDTDILNAYSPAMQNQLDIGYANAAGRALREAGSQPSAEQQTEAIGKILRMGRATLTPAAQGRWILADKLLGLRVGLSEEEARQIQKYVK